MKKTSDPKNGKVQKAQSYEMPDMADMGAMEQGHKKLSGGLINEMQNGSLYDPSVKPDGYPGGNRSPQVPMKKMPKKAKY